MKDCRLVRGEGRLRPRACRNVGGGRGELDVRKEATSRSGVGTKSL